MCLLANEVHRNSIKKVNKFAAISDSPIAAFQMRENITLFIRFCRDVCGLPEKDLFSTDDLMPSSLVSPTPEYPSHAIAISPDGTIL